MAKINYQNLPSTTTPLNATNLNSMQETITSQALSSLLVNSWATNGYNKVIKDNNIVHLTMSVRYGTAAKILTLPAGYRPSSTVILPSYNGSVGNLVTVGTTGDVTVLDSSQIGSSVCFSTTYTTD